MQKSLLIFLLSLFFLAPSLELSARGGGGGRSGGGGGGGGYSGGGRYYHGYYYGHGGGHHNAFDPVVTTIVVIITVIFFSVALTGILFLSLVKSKSAKRALKKAASVDPFWDEEKMNLHCKNVFLQIQDNWSNNDLTPMYHLVTNDFYIHYQHLLSRYRKMNIKNSLHNIEITTQKIVKIYDDQDNEQDFFVVYFKGKMIDYLVNTKTGIIIDGDKDYADSFEDIYVFFRRNNQWLLNQIINDPNHSYMRLVKKNYGEKQNIKPGQGSRFIEE